MAFEDLRDQLSEKWSESWSQLQDSPTYNNLSEKYSNLPPAGQKGVIGFVVIICAYILWSIPQSFLSSADTHMEDFETNRALLRSLLKAGRLAKSQGNLPSGPSTSMLRSRAQRLFTNSGLTPDQVGEITDQVKKLSPKIAPPALVQNGLKIQLKDLNLRQTIQLSQQMSQIDNYVRLMDLKIKATTEDPHYFNVELHLVSFSAPQTKEPPGGSRRGKGS